MQIRFEDSSGNALPALQLEVHGDRILLLNAGLAGGTVNVSIGGQNGTLSAGLGGGVASPLTIKGETPGFRDAFGDWLTQTLGVTVPGPGPRIAIWEYRGQMAQGWATLLSALGLFIGLWAVLGEIDPDLPSFLSIGTGLFVMVLSVLAFVLFWAWSLFCTRKVQAIASEAGR